MSLFMIPMISCNWCYPMSLAETLCLWLLLITLFDDVHLNDIFFSPQVDPAVVAVVVEAVQSVAVLEEV